MDVWVYLWKSDNRLQFMILSTDALSFRYRLLVNNGQYKVEVWSYCSLQLMHDLYAMDDIRRFMINFDQCNDK